MPTTPTTSLMRAIKNAIKAKLGTVPGLFASTIHARTRNFAGQNESYFEALFAAGSPPRLNGWEIEHESGSSSWIATNDAWDRRDVIAIRGYYGVDDANDSEASFSLLVEGVIDVLNADQSLGGAVGVRTHGTAQVRSYGHAMLGGKLVHFCELALTVTWANQLS